MTTSLVAEILRDQFPQLACTSVAYLNQGCDSTAFEVNGTWVFRFPKRADVDRQLLIEKKLLPPLAEQSPVPLPSFTHHGRPSPRFPFHFVGYPKLPGVPGIQLDPASVPFASLAPALGEFLGWLHSRPVADAARAGVEAVEIKAFIAEVRAEALENFALLHQVAPHEPLDEWYAYLNGRPDVEGSSSPALLHNDLAAEHILVDAEALTLTGVVDWSDMAIGDRAIDFAGVCHWGGEPFMNAILASYAGPVHASTRACARYFGACRGVGDVAFGLEHDRPEYLAAGVRALHLCVP